MSPPSDPVRELLRAALSAARHLLGDEQADRASRVVVYCREGRRVIDLAISLGLSGDYRAVAGETPVFPPGWSFTDRVAMFDGQPVPVAASRVKLLRALAESREPLTAKQLTEVVFDRETDVANTRFHIRELRRELKAAFPDFETEIVAGESEGYRLVLR